MNWVWCAAVRCSSGRSAPACQHYCRALEKFAILLLFWFLLKVTRTVGTVSATGFCTWFLSSFLCLPGRQAGLSAAWVVHLACCPAGHEDRILPAGGFYFWVTSASCLLDSLCLPACSCCLYIPLYISILPVPLLPYYTAWSLTFLFFSSVSLLGGSLVHLKVPAACRFLPAYEWTERDSCGKHM